MNGGESSSKRSKIEQQKIYNDKRKEKPRKPQFSINFQFDFGEEEEMKTAQQRFARLRDMAKFGSGRKNADFLTVLLDRFEGVEDQEEPERREMHSVSVQANATDSVFELYAHRHDSADFQCQWPDKEAPDMTQVLSAAHPEEEYFVCGHNSLRVLLQQTGTGCQCGRQFLFQDYVQSMDGHVLRITFNCSNGHQIKWSSSSIIGNKYTANCRIVHGFTSSGLLESQYQSLAEAAKFGNVGNKYIDYVYQTMGYIDIVDDTASLSMQLEINSAKETDNYHERNGATVITDCRHDSTANAYHSTVVMLSYESKKVVAFQTVTKEEIRSSQTHEFEAMRKIVPSVQERGLNIAEVAHDYVPKIKNWLLEQNIRNSFDTWHGTKGVAKAMKDISAGAQKWEGTKWFSELSDKQASVKRHYYYSMKNCRDAEDLQCRLINIIPHYQGDHSNCDIDSSCKLAGYRCSKVPLTKPESIDALRKFILQSKVYRFAEDYYQCRDTYWVESFNNVILIYAPKRIHFSDRIFDMRISLAALDWNENVNREASSISLIQDVRRPTRRTGHKNLLHKTFQFRHDIWRTFFNKSTLRPPVAHIWDTLRIWIPFAATDPYLLVFSK